MLDAIGLLSDLPIYIDETPFQTSMELRSKSRRLHQEKGSGLADRGLYPARGHRPERQPGDRSG